MLWIRRTGKGMNEWWRWNENIFFPCTQSLACDDDMTSFFFPSHSHSHGMDDVAIASLATTSFVCPRASQRHVARRAAAPSRTVDPPKRRKKGKGGRWADDV